VDVAVVVVTQDVSK